MENYVKLQSSVFGDFKHLEAIPEYSKMFQGLLEPYNVLQNTFIDQEVNIKGIKQYNRLQFTSSDYNFGLKIGINRLDLVVIYNLDTSDIISVDEFLKLSTDIFSKILSELDLRANRISYISEYFDDTETRKYSDFLIPNDFFASNVVEWNTRQHRVHNMDIKNYQEKLNVIMVVKDSSGVLENLNKRLNLKGISFGLDINTHQNTRALRIDSDFVTDFYVQIREIISELEKSYA